MSSPVNTTASLADIATDDGTFAVVAMDQRNTLKRMFAAVGHEDPTDEELRGVKADVITALAPAASAFLLDPTYGVPALHSVSDSLAKVPGVLVAAEPSSRGNYNGEPRASLAPGQDARWVRDQGGSASKFLVQLRADRQPTDGVDLAARGARRRPRADRGLPRDRRPVGGGEPDLPAARRGAADARAPGRRDHRGGRRARRAEAGPAQAGVPRQPGGVPPAGRRAHRAVGRALGRRRLRRVRGGPARSPATRAAPPASSPAAPSGRTRSGCRPVRGSSTCATRAAAGSRGAWPAIQDRARPWTEVSA